MFNHSAMAYHQFILLRMDFVEIRKEFAQTKAKSLSLSAVTISIKLDLDYVDFEHNQTTNETSNNSKSLEIEVTSIWD